jgi:CubicO group peptidase (beta-lactamase class C family)
LGRATPDALAAHVGGRGCVVRRGALAYTWDDPALSGDLASARKPISSTLLLCAVQEGKLRGVDDRSRQLSRGCESSTVARTLGLPSGICGRRPRAMANREAPGAAWSYSDCVFALYYAALTSGVPKGHGTEVP